MLLVIIKNGDLSYILSTHGEVVLAKALTAFRDAENTSDDDKEEADRQLKAMGAPESLL